MTAEVLSQSILMVEVMFVPKPQLMMVGMRSQLMTGEVLPKFKLMRILTVVVLSVSQLKKEVVQSQSRVRVLVPADEGGGMPKLMKAKVTPESQSMTVEVLPKSKLMRGVAWSRLMMGKVMSAGMTSQSQVMTVMMQPDSKLKRVVTWPWIMSVEMLSKS